MPVIVQTVVSTVTALWGRTFIRLPNGQFRLLQIGDVVARGDVLLTEQNAIAQLSSERPGSPAADLPPVRLLARAGRTPLDEIDRTIDGMERGEIKFATAAGSRAADGGLTEATRVQRINETLNPGFELDSSTPRSALAATLPITVAAIAPPIVARIATSVQNIGAAEANEGAALVFPVTPVRHPHRAFDLAAVDQPRHGIGAGPG